MLSTFLSLTLMLVTHLAFLVFSFDRRLSYYTHGIFFLSYRFSSLRLFVMIMMISTDVDGNVCT